MRHACKRERSIYNYVSETGPDEWLVRIGYFFLTEQNSLHFAEDLVKYISLNEHHYISIQMTLKFVPGGLIYSESGLVRMMLWCLKYVTSHKLDHCWPSCLTPYGVTNSSTFTLTVLGLRWAQYWIQSYMYIYIYIFPWLHQWPSMILYECCIRLDRRPSK